MEKVLFKENKGRDSKKGDNMLDSLFAKGLLVVISIFLIYNVFKSVETTLFKLDILEQAKGEVDELRLKNIEYLLAKQTGETDEYIEVEARNRLNYSQDDEMVFIIPENVLIKAGEQVDLILGKTLIEDVVIQDVWEVWYDFLIVGV